MAGLLFFLTTPLANGWLNTLSILFCCSTILDLMNSWLLPFHILFFFTCSFYHFLNTPLNYPIELSFLDLINHSDLTMLSFLLNYPFLTYDYPFIIANMNLLHKLADLHSRAWVYLLWGRYSWKDTVSSKKSLGSRTSNEETRTQPDELWIARLILLLHRTRMRREYRLCGYLSTTDYLTRRL